MYNDFAFIINCFIEILTTKDYTREMHLRSFVSGIRSLTENKRASFQRLKKRNTNFWKCIAICKRVISRTSAFDSFNLHKPPTLLMCKSTAFSKADVRHLFLLVPNFTGVRGRLRIGSFKCIIKIIFLTGKWMS